jgi:hypothetical protein
MNTLNERSPLLELEPQSGVLPTSSAIAERSETSPMSDRLYQIAALTAGAFLLASLL